MRRLTRMSYEEKEKRKLNRWFSKLTTESEFFGLLSQEHSNSFYRVFVRQNSSTKKWWKFQRHGHPSLYDPIKYQKNLAKESKVESVHGKLSDLLRYKFNPEAKGLQELFDKVKELNTL